VTSSTEFHGSVAATLAEVRVGHDVEASFFIVTEEAEVIETTFPDFF